MDGGEARRKKRKKKTMLTSLVFVRFGQQKWETRVQRRGAQNARAQSERAEDRNAGEKTIHIFGTSAA